MVFLKINNYDIFLCVCVCICWVSTYKIIMKKILKPSNNHKKKIYRILKNQQQNKLRMNT